MHYLTPVAQILTIQHGIPNTDPGRAREVELGANMIAIQCDIVDADLRCAAIVIPYRLAEYIRLTLERAGAHELAQDIANIQALIP